MRMKTLSICCYYYKRWEAESVALPLGDAPILIDYSTIIIAIHKKQAIFTKFFNFLVYKSKPSFYLRHKVFDIYQSII